MASNSVEKKIAITEAVGKTIISTKLIALSSSGRIYKIFFDDSTYAIIIKPLPNYRLN